VFVGDVLSTRVALAIWIRSVVVGVRAGAEVCCFPPACFYASTVLWESKLC
jgi:hypothetical protein